MVMQNIHSPIHSLLIGTDFKDKNKKKFKKIGNEVDGQDNSLVKD